MDYHERGEKKIWGWIKRVKREWETGQKVSDLTHSIHPLFLHHPLLVHAFVHLPPPLFFCTCLCPCPPCLSVWPAECGCHGERARVSALSGRECDEAIVKATASYCVHVQPTAPQKWASLSLSPDAADGEGLSGCGMEVRQLFAALLRPILQAGVPSSAEHC